MAWELLSPLLAQGPGFRGFHSPHNELPFCLRRPHYISSRKKHTFLRCRYQFGIRKVALFKLKNEGPSGPTHGSNVEQRLHECGRPFGVVVQDPDVPGRGE